MKMRLIMNPGSRSGRGRKLWSFWDSSLKARGIDFDCMTTASMGHAVELARDAQDYDVVVAIGGDGTINEVIDGVMQSGRSDLRMGVLYSGTSPDFCRFHGIPVSPSEAVDALIAGRTASVDVARITYTLDDGHKMTSHFGCGSNIGLGAMVARDSNRMRRFTGDMFGTGIALIHAITAMKPMNLDLEVDGISVKLSEVNNLSILKNPYLASGLRLNLDLSVNDGKLVLFAVTGKSRLSLLKVLPGFYSGKAVEGEGVFCRTCSRVSIRCRESREIEFDGDPRGFLPAGIKIISGALNLIGVGP